MRNSSGSASNSQRFPRTLRLRSTSNTLKIAAPDSEPALRTLYAELGFTSLMRDLAPDPAAQSAQPTD